MIRLALAVLAALAALPAAADLRQGYSREPDLIDRPLYWTGADRPEVSHNGALRYLMTFNGCPKGAVEDACVLIFVRTPDGPPYRTFSARRDDFSLQPVDGDLRRGDLVVVRRLSAINADGALLWRGEFHWVERIAEDGRPIACRPDKDDASRLFCEKVADTMRLPLPPEVERERLDGR